MTMRGIDISNWQAGLNIAKMDCDFFIMKATEGKTFVDAYCNEWVDDCIRLKKPFGFYHFASTNNPIEEANFFYRQCKGYFGKGIPVLDYEVENSNNAQWCEKFIKRIHDLSGVWCMLYISAYRVGHYNNSWIPEKCPLWIAGYPRTYAYWTIDEMPYSVKPWANAVIWQFTSQLILHGYVGKLDGDIAYISAKRWNNYAKAKTTQTTNETEKKQTIDDIVRDVLDGKYGNGETRKKKLGKNYAKVQKRIDKLYDIADEVIEGKWGKGWNREQSLNGAGYPYELVQRIVNEKMA